MCARSGVLVPAVPMSTDGTLGRKIYACYSGLICNSDHGDPVSLSSGGWRKIVDVIGISENHPMPIHVAWIGCGDFREALAMIAAIGRTHNVHITGFEITQSCVDNFRVAKHRAIERGLLSPEDADRLRIVLCDACTLPDCLNSPRLELSFTVIYSIAVSSTELYKRVVGMALGTPTIKRCAMYNKSWMSLGINATQGRAEEMLRLREHLRKVQTQLTGGGTVRDVWCFPIRDAAGNLMQSGQIIEQVLTREC